MPYNHPIPDAPVAPSMLPRVPAENLTSQDVLVLTQPGNNPGQKNKGLELGTLFDALFAAQAYAAGASYVNSVFRVKIGIFRFMADKRLCIYSFDK